MHLVNDKTTIGDQGIVGEELAPIVHMINFKSRRVLMCRGDNAQADAVSRGFKKVTSAHFLKFVGNAPKGFRTKKKGKRK